MIPCLIPGFQEFKARYANDAKSRVLTLAGRIEDNKLRNLVVEFGIGYHHVGSSIFLGIFITYTKLSFNCIFALFTFSTTFLIVE